MKTLATTTIQKHSRRPPGLTSQAATSARTQQTAVNHHASAIPRRPEGSGRSGLAIRSIPRSQIWLRALLAAFSVAAMNAPRIG